MKRFPEPLDLRQVKVYPLADRESLSKLDDVLIRSEAPAPPTNTDTTRLINDCASRIISARQRGASVMLLYGAHLIKNGAMALMISLLREGWVTHLATNGAGTIHDWEFSFLGRSEESVRKNVATGKFGTWDETGRCLQLALLAGGLGGEGYGRSLGRFVIEDGTALPTKESLESLLRNEPGHPLASARADLLGAMLTHDIPSGRIEVKHPWKETCVVAQAFQHNVPLTVHPGIGYDIFTTHPMFNGAVVGRAADIDFRLFCRAVDGLDGGIVLSVGSAIMAPQVFEKSLSCVNNLRIQQGRTTVTGHAIYVVDIQDGGNWDWSKGEPTKTNPAYYLRFCKSFARMGGEMRYVQCDNAVFLHSLLHRLETPGN